MSGSSISVIVDPNNEQCCSNWYNFYSIGEYWISDVYYFGISFEKKIIGFGAFIINIIYSWRYSVAAFVKCLCMSNEANNLSYCFCYCSSNWPLL